MQHVPDHSPVYKLENASELFSLIFDYSSNGIIVTDKNIEVICANPAYQEITGQLNTDCVGRPPLFLSGKKSIIKQSPQFWVELLSKNQWEGEVRIYKNEDSYVHCLLNAKVIKNIAGSITSYVFFLSDISSIKQDFFEKLNTAKSDPLTGLKNRDLFFEELLPVFNRNPQGLGIAIVFIDLDGLKKINDSYGHEVGDCYIKTASKRLKNLMRRGDVLSRFGGDEFVAALIDVDSIDTAHHMVKRMHDGLCQPIIFEDDLKKIPSLPIGASLGVSHCICKSFIDLTNLISQADEKMYRVKKIGGGVSFE